MEELNKKLIELFKEMAIGQGLNDPLLISMFARLYIEPEPIAMDDLAEETGYSLASVCNKLKMLAPILQIKKTRKPGSKKVFLYMEKDFLTIWKDALVKKQKYVINRVKEKLPPILKEFEKKVKTPKDEKKLENLKLYYEQVLKLEKVINKMIKELDMVK